MCSKYVKTFSLLHVSMVIKLAFSYDVVSYLPTHATMHTEIIHGKHDGTTKYTIRNSLKPSPLESYA